MKSFFSRWYVILIIWFGICGALITLGVLSVGRMVYTSVCIDANPSITVKLDKEGFVLAVVGENEDGKEVLEQVKQTFKEDYEEPIKGQDAETVVSEVVNKALELGYLNEEQSALLLSVKSRDEEIADELQLNLAYVASDAMESELDNAVVLDQTITVDSTVRAISGIYHITQGKAYLVWQLCMAQPELQVWDLADMTITELIMECIDKDINLAQYIDIIGEGLEDFYSDYEEEDEDDEYYEDLPAPEFDEDFDEEFEEDFESDYADDYSTVDDEVDEDIEEDADDTIGGSGRGSYPNPRVNASSYNTAEDIEDDEDEDLIEEEDEPADNNNSADYPKEQLPGDVYIDDGN